MSDYDGCNPDSFGDGSDYDPPMRVREILGVSAVLGGVVAVLMGGFGTAVYLIDKDVHKSKIAHIKKAKGELKKQHMQAMRQAASLSLVGAYSLQFLESPTYNVQWSNGFAPDGVNYASFGNACLKGTEFDPDTAGATIDIVDVTNIKVNSVDGYSLSLEYSDKLGRFTPLNPEDKEITRQKKCSYSLRNFGSQESPSSN